MITSRLENFPILQRRAQYKRGKKYRYFAYREAIREDCQNRCVYCDSHEDEIGGDGMFHLDHFRPRKYFPQLEDSPANLVWSCSRCNLLKRDDWPALELELPEGEFIPQQAINGSIGYLDPFAVDRRQYFVIAQDGAIEPLCHPGEYLIKKLALNRPFLRLNRYRRHLVLKMLAYLEQKESEIRQKNLRVCVRLEAPSTDQSIRDDLCELKNAYEDQLCLIDSYRKTILVLL